LDDEPQCTFQFSKVTLIMDKYATHPFEHVGSHESFGFSTLLLRNNIITFLPPNVTSVIQPLDKGILASFKVYFMKKLLEWVLFQFDSSTTHHDFRNIMPNVRQAIMCCS
jgi:hypothetical protein